MGAPTLGCARCGDCCDPVYLTPENAAKLADPGTTGDRASSEFAREHWHQRAQSPLPDHLAYDCDQFDPASRLCTAGDDRPPVCRYYPWYLDGPCAERAADLHSHCSYLLQVMPADRPEGSRPLIPIEVIRR